MQFQGKQPISFVYNTSMNRPDAALALALLFGYSGKREARVMAIAVTGSGLGAAAYCNLVSLFYQGGQGRMSTGPDSNRFLPIGLAIANPQPPDAAMLKPALDQTAYKRTIGRPADTSEVCAMIRNAFTGVQNGNGIMLLSAPATSLAQAMTLPGTKVLLGAKIKTLLLCDTADLRSDPAALKKITSDWPGQIVWCGSGVSEALRFPGSSVDKDFAWANTPSHPVADVYRALKSMTYDEPCLDLAAALYAVHPELGFFDLQDSKTPGAGPRDKDLRVVPGQQEAILKTMVEIASAKLPAPRAPFRPPAK